MLTFLKKFFKPKHPPENSTAPYKIEAPVVAEPAAPTPIPLEPENWPYPDKVVAKPKAPAKPRAPRKPKASA